MRYLRGHAPRDVEHRLSDIDERLLVARCTRCEKEVQISRDGGRWRCRGDVTKSHILIEVDEAARTGFCRRCRERVDIVKAPRAGWACGVSRRKWSKNYRADNGERLRDYSRGYSDANRDRLRASQRTRKYGLSPEQFEQLMIIQRGQCAICRRTAPIGVKTRDQVLHVDHAHDTGKVRGLLCNDCNIAIGMLADDVERLRAAIEYLSVHLTPPSG